MNGRMNRIGRTNLWAHLLLVCFALFTHPLFGATGEGFSFHREAWKATDVVLVEIAEPSGTFEVVETWKGNANIGERIFLPELIPAASAKPLSAYPVTNPWESFDSESIRQQIPKQPKGSRLVFFLKRESGAKDRVQWKATHEAGLMKWSAVWIEEGRLFTFQPISDAGPSLLYNWSPKTSEADLKEQVEHVAQVQQQFQQVLETTQAAQRAQTLVPFLKSDVVMAHTSALDELEKTGKPAIPTVEAMLDDPSYGSGTSLIYVLVRVGGESVAPFLNAHFEREVAFWESNANSIPRNWLANGRYDNLLGQHDGLTQFLIEALKTTHFEGALQPALRLHKLWISLPHLNDSVGARSVGRTCEQLIVALQQPQKDSASCELHPCPLP